MSNGESLLNPEYLKQQNAGGARGPRRGIRPSRPGRGPEPQDHLHLHRIPRFKELRKSFQEMLRLCVHIEEGVGHHPQSVGIGIVRVEADIADSMHFIPKLRALLLAVEAKEA